MRGAWSYASAASAATTPSRRGAPPKPAAKSRRAAPPRAEPPRCGPAQPTSRDTAEPPRRDAESRHDAPPSRRAAELPRCRAAARPSRRAAEPPRYRAELPCRVAGRPESPRRRAPRCGAAAESRRAAVPLAEPQHRRAAAPRRSHRTHNDPWLTGVASKDTGASLFLTLVVMVSLDHGLCEVFRRGDVTKRGKTSLYKATRGARVSYQQHRQTRFQEAIPAVRSPCPTSAAASRLVLRGRHGAARPLGGGAAAARCRVTSPYRAAVKPYGLRPYLSGQSNRASGHADRKSQSDRSTTTFLDISRGGRICSERTYHFKPRVQIAGSRSMLQLLNATADP